MAPAPAMALLPALAPAPAWEAGAACTEDGRLAQRGVEHGVAPGDAPPPARESEGDGVDDTRRERRVEQRALATQPLEAPREERFAHAASRQPVQPPGDAVAQRRAARRDGVPLRPRAHGGAAAPVAARGAHAAQVWPRVLREGPRVHRALARAVRVEHIRLRSEQPLRRHVHLGARRRGLPARQPRAVDPGEQRRRLLLLLLLLLVVVVVVVLLLLPIRLENC